MSRRRSYRVGMSTAELRELIAGLAIAQRETDRQQQQTDRQIKELGQQTDRQIKELGQQIGGLGNKFGAFSEGLAYGSIRRILREDFGMETIVHRMLVKKGAGSAEYDILAYNNGGSRRGVVVEVKSLLDRRAIEQMRRTMDSLFEWLPEHRDKAFVGMVAYVDGQQDAREAVLAEGWHLVHVGDDLFKVETPPGFQPRIYRAAPDDRLPVPQSGHLP